jgi:hypothetical protein
MTDRDVPRVKGLLAELDKARQAITEAASVREYDNAKKLVAFIRSRLERYGVRPE